MVMTSIGNSPITDAAPRQSPNRANLIRLLLIIVAIGKVVTSFTSSAVLFDPDPTIPGTSWGGLVISAVIVLSPILAAVALFFAIRGPIARAIIPIGALALLDWLSYVPSLVNHRSEFPTPGFMGVVEIAQFVVLPALVMLAVVLAWRGERLGLAAGLALLPTFVNIAGVIAFGVAVAIYGF